jgi:hypothetical protein
MNKRIGLVLGLWVVAGSLGAAEVADVTSLAWMAGSWQGTAGGVEMEEHWLAPKGGAMLGMHRDVTGGRMVSFEFLRIEKDAEGLVYLASPQGRPVTPFRLIESKKGRAVFSNPQHDFPQRVLYWMGDDGLLHARIEGQQKGQPASEEWAWKRSR